MSLLCGRITLDWGALGTLPLLTAAPSGESPVRLTGWGMGGVAEEERNRISKFSFC